jgi:serine/threonine protein kinase
VAPDIIAGRYRVEREVGRGGMGSVWLCLDERLGRPVALKQVGGLPGESSMHLARALREARHSAALNHPNVVAIFDALEDNDHVWLVMEYVPSRTLDDIVRSEGPLPPAEAARIGADVADGLAAAHALGTVHRDVKPSNILVRDHDGRALIADFGIARTVGQEQLTRSGLVTGTPAYFAPELARGEEPAPASDTWALGVSLYFAVEGHQAYAEQANAIALLNTIAHQPPPEPVRAGALGEALEHMLDRDPESRWSMARAAEALREVASPGPVPVPPSAEPVLTPVREERAPATVPTARAPATAPGSAPDPGPAPERRRPALLAVAVLALLVLMAAGGWWLVRQPDSEGTDHPAAAATGQPSEPASRKPSRTPSHQPSDQSSEQASDRPSDRPSRTPTPSPSVPPSSAPPSSPSSTVTPVEGSPSSPAGLVADYYGLLPEDADAAWAMLTPALQDRIGRGTFYGFWATIDDVRVEDTRTVGEGVVQVTLTYVTDGRAELETRQLEVESTGDGLLISADDGAV